MKMIMALIEPQKFPEVRQALFDIDVRGMTVSNAMGSSREVGFKETYRGVDVDMYLFKKVRLEIAVSDDRVEPVVEAICRSARMDLPRTHGMIFVYELCDAVKVTGERGVSVI
jgi:nitrogen regulatory protein P-II 2